MNCASGKVFGGGVKGENAIVLHSSFPSDNGTTWRVRVSNNGNSERTITVFATCAAV